MIRVKATIVLVLDESYMDEDIRPGSAKYEHWRTVEVPESIVEMIDEEFGDTEGITVEGVHTEVTR